METAFSTIIRQMPKVLSITNEIAVSRIERVAAVQLFGKGELARAAAGHALEFASSVHPDPIAGALMDAAMFAWPWEFGEFTPRGEKRGKLVIAAALLVAEIERIDSDGWKRFYRN